MGDRLQGSPAAQTQWPKQAASLGRMTDSQEGGRSARGWGTGSKSKLEGRTIRRRVETKPKQNGSWVIPGAALVNQASILEKTQAVGRTFPAAFSQESLEGRAGSPPSGVGSPRPASLHRASQPSSARQCPAEGRAGRRQRGEGEVGPGWAAAADAVRGQQPGAPARPWSLEPRRRQAASPAEGAGRAYPAGRRPPAACELLRRRARHSSAPCPRPSSWGVVSGGEGADARQP